MKKKLPFGICIHKLKRPKEAQLIAFLIMPSPGPQHFLSLTEALNKLKVSHRIFVVSHITATGNYNRKLGHYRYFP